MKGTLQWHYTMDVFHFDEVRYNNRHIPFQGHSLMYIHLKANILSGHIRHTSCLQIQLCFAMFGDI